jgi:hypothetical protein
MDSIEQQQQANIDRAGSKAETTGFDRLAPIEQQQRANIDRAGSEAETIGSIFFARMIPLLRLMVVPIPVEIYLPNRQTLQCAQANNVT